MVDRIVGGTRVVRHLHRRDEITLDDLVEERAQRRPGLLPVSAGRLDIQLARSIHGDIECYGGIVRVQADEAVPDGAFEAVDDEVMSLLEVVDQHRGVDGHAPRHREDHGPQIESSLKHKYPPSDGINSVYLGLAPGYACLIGVNHAGLESQRARIVYWTPELCVIRGRPSFTRAFSSFLTGTWPSSDRYCRVMLFIMRKKVPCKKTILRFSLATMRRDTKMSRHQDMK